MWHPTYIIAKNRKYVCIHVLINYVHSENNSYCNLATIISRWKI